MRLMIYAASLPKPLRITRRGSLRTLLAVRAMPMAPSAAAKDSCPARNAKHWVSSRQQHLAQIAVAQAHLALFGHRAGHAEGLQALADNGGSLGGVRDALLQRQSHAQGIGPDGIFKRNGLHALDDGVHIDALGQAQIAGPSSRTARCRFSARNFSILAMRRSLPSNFTSLAI